MTLIRKIEHAGRAIEIAVDHKGIVMIDGHSAGRPQERADALPAGKVAFVWGGAVHGLPTCKITFTAAELATITAAGAEYQANLARTIRAQEAKATAWDALHNEGGDGYNPHRTPAIDGSMRDTDADMGA